MEELFFNLLQELLTKPTHSIVQGREKNKTWRILQPIHVNIMSTLDEDPKVQPK
jgi:type VI protein secretion system component VasA